MTMTPSDRMRVTPYDRMRVYVAAPYAMSGVVRSFHQRLREDGFGVTSSWAETPSAADSVPEDLPSMSRSQHEEISTENDEGVASAHVVVALCYRGLGKEMFCECALARLLGRPIVWVADDLQILPLSAFRRGSVRVNSVDLAVPVLASIRAGDLPELRVGRW